MFCLFLAAILDVHTRSYFAAAQTWILSRDCLHFCWRHIITSKGYYACSTILQFLEFSRKTVVLCRRKKNYRVFSLTWPASVCKFIGTKESVYIRKEFNFHRTSLWHQHGSLRTADAFPVVASQHGRRFIVLGHQNGRRDVMWKRSIPVYSVDTYWLKRHVMQLVSRYNCEHDLLWRTCENRTNNNIDWNLQERYWTLWSLFLSSKIWFKSKSPARKWTRKCAFSFYLIYNRVIPGVI